MLPILLPSLCIKSVVQADRELKPGKAEKTASEALGVTLFPNLCLL